MKHDWSDGAIVLLALTRLCFMNFILVTKYTLSILSLYQRKEAAIIIGVYQSGTTKNLELSAGAVES
jgi:hypothetical protein